ncbi:hypothetical protein [Streptomyces sp. NPDC049585]|uniref:hypothetical protein n=1 Tax=Streptomyces sp. NPDC049585 TaxID=3155154 RepID=UPI0034350686
MAAAGYGKRSAPDQAPRAREMFAHLPAREAYIATYVDRLPDGAAMDVKTLARTLPYGQQAIRSALTNLSEAGHLRRVREMVGEGRTQWVWRTYFSRTARDDAWWEEHLEVDAPPEPKAQAAPTEEPEAYEALAAVGRADSRMGLSHAECVALAPLAALWLARGATREALVRALTAGLPAVVHAPGALARTRLRGKLPPEPPQPAAPVVRLLECTGCGTPGRPEALAGGLCRACHGRPPEEPATVDVAALAAAARAASRAGRDRFVTSLSR